MHSKLKVQTQGSFQFDLFQFNHDKNVLMIFSHFICESQYEGQKQMNLNKTEIFCSGKIE